MLVGFCLATAGFSIYETFDFLTFQETMKNFDWDTEIKEASIAELLGEERNFTLEGDAKAAMVIFMGGLLMIFLGQFASLIILDFHKDVSQ